MIFHILDQHVDAMFDGGILPLIKSLLLDPVPSIQQSASIALGRLVSHSAQVCDSVVSDGFLEILIQHLQLESKHYKKAAAFVLRSLAKHGERHAQAVAASGAIPPLVACLSESDLSVKESSIWAIGFIARHSASLAQAVVDCGTVPLLAEIYKGSEMTLRRISVSTLSDIAKHSEVLTDLVVETGIVPQFIKDIENVDTGLRRQVSACLSQIGKHSEHTASLLVRHDMIPRAILALKDANEHVAKNACTIIRDVARHNESLAKQVVAGGGIAGLVEYLEGVSIGVNRTPALAALGNIAGTSDTLALAVISGGVIASLSSSLVDEPEDSVRSVTAWVLGQIGRHSPEHARQLVDADCLRKLLAVFIHQSSSDELRDKCEAAFKRIVQNVVDVSKLEPLIAGSPQRLLIFVVKQLAKILSKNSDGRKHFVQSGCLQQLQRVKFEPDSKYASAIKDLNALYPVELISYFSPTYPDQLIQKLEDFVPPPLTRTESDDACDP